MNNLNEKEIKDYTENLKQIMDKVDEIYGKHRLPGTLIISGVTIALFTIVLSFLTGVEGSKVVGISIYEEILFGCISIAFILIGTLFLNAFNRRKIEVQMKSFELSEKRSEYYHLEQIERSKIEAKNQSGTSNGNGDSDQSLG